MLAIRETLEPTYVLLIQMNVMTQGGRYGKYIQSLCTIVDFLVLNIVFMFTCELEHDNSDFCSRLVWFFVNLSYVPVVLWFRNYRQIRSARMDVVVLNALKAVGLHALCFLSILFLLSIENISLVTYLTFYGTGFVAMPVWWVVSRMLMRRYRSRGRNFTRVIIVGANATAERLYNEMMSEAGFGYCVVGVFGIDHPAGLPDYLHRGQYGDVENFVRQEPVDEIYYALSGRHEEILRRTIKAANDNMIPFYYVPQISRYIPGRFELLTMGSMPMLSLNCNPLKRTVNRVIKRLFDVVFASAVLIVAGPLVFIPVAVAIKLSSPGPVFFRQKRTGYRGIDFHCLKFRTMKVNAESDRLQAQENDPRKTRVGDFLRRASIDELPQFINVLKGEMSVVGPRPHMLSHTDEYRRLIDKYMVRHKVKPGITGWAQVNGWRGPTTELWLMEKRVEHDVWYIENWSFLLDLKIVARTVFNAIKGEKNAF